MINRCQHVLGSELGRSLGGEIALINVNDPAMEYDRAEQESKRLLSGFRDRLALPHSTHEFVQTGIPAPTIVQKAKKWPADLIVIASHGRSGVSRALLGSVERSLSGAGRACANVSNLLVFGAEVELKAEFRRVAIYREPRYPGAP